MKYPVAQTQLPEVHTLLVPVQSEFAVHTSNMETIFYQYDPTTTVKRIPPTNEAWSTSLASLPILLRPFKVPY